MYEYKFVKIELKSQLFAHDGSVTYTFECKDNDFKQKVMHTIEFSNYQWA